MKVFLVFIVFFSTQSWGLPIDAKVLGRIIGASDSKRTVLINRGQEHGLRVGDHAKISLPSGMVARGVVVKMSPGRSVWSLYRFFDVGKIATNMVYTFKIAEPVKLTSDETKSLGILAKKEIKKRESIKSPALTPKEIRRQKIMRDDLINREKIVQKPDGVDYSGLEDHKIPLTKRDTSIDWRYIDEKDDHDQFRDVDYSGLY